jgi:hypothetical protein
VADTYVSRHFTLEELACHDQARTPYPVMWRLTRLPILLAEAEAVRAECCVELGADCPLLVNSGFRTVAHNASLDPVFKAAPSSQHCEGRALDLVASYLSFSRFQAAVRRASKREGSLIRFVEWRKTMGYIHIDTRPTDTLVAVTII